MTSLTTLLWRHLLLFYDVTNPATLTSLTPLLWRHCPFLVYLSLYITCLHVRRVQGLYVLEKHQYQHGWRHNPYQVRCWRHNGGFDDVIMEGLMTSKWRVWWRQNGGFDDVKMEGLMTSKWGIDDVIMEGLMTSKWRVWWRHNGGIDDVIIEGLMTS